MTEEGAPGVTVGLVEAIVTVKTSSPSAIASSVVAIMAVIVPSDIVPDANVTVNGVGSVKSAVAVKVHNNGIRRTCEYNTKVGYELDCWLVECNKILGMKFPISHNE